MKLKKWVNLALLGGVIALGSGVMPAMAKTETVVLVHGAFADGSSWNAVISELQKKHLDVIAVQIPLTSLKDDVAATKRAIEQAHGDVLLVGHSWGGTVITEAGNNPKVKSLVYIAAFAPAAGQSTSELASSFPAPPGSAGIAKTPAGYLYLPEKAVKEDFAQDVPSETQRLITVTQGPIKASAFDEKITQPAWKTKPVWYLVSSEDRMINPDLERSMAKSVNAKIEEVKASHVSMISQPDSVAKIILQAADGKAPKS
ncbi:alpha/beta hydrolase [Salmonella enterica subsp. enterica serovar Choleraesuis]|nr:alpha/beta hydrolase [Salmonella enterica subsp. enterica serovar Choleraesuis]